MPFITLVWAAIDTFYALTPALSPVHALISSIVLLCGWLVQFSVWMQCELTAPNINESFASSSWCPTSNLSNVSTPQYYAADNTAAAKTFIGLVVLVGAFVYMVLAAVVLGRNRRVGKGVVLLKEREQAEDSTTVSETA